MAVTTTNLISGPVTIYVGDFGATEPTDSAINSTPAASAWEDAGGTQGGVQIVVGQEYYQLEVDQIVDNVESRLTKRDVRVVTNLAEATLENMQRVFNGGTVTAGANTTSYTPAMDTAATQPDYRAILVDGWAPGTGGSRRRRTVFRKVLSVEEVESNHAKDEQTLLPVTWRTHYVSDVITPWRVLDDTTA